MSLRVKQIGQLMMAVALFFLSCEEETTFLGYKADQRFSVNYIEIPVESSVYLHDSVVTSNFFTETLNRFLVGTYQDNLFGTVSSTAYSQITRVTNLPDSLTFGVYDSISLQLRFDLNYVYGSNTVSPQEIAVYELDETLERFDSLKRYYSGSTVQLKPDLLGSKTFAIDPEAFKELVEDRVDTTITIRLKLSDELGMRIFDKVVTYRDSSSSFFYEEIRNSVKGLAITPTQSDKIVSFNPSTTQSKIVVHFHINKRDSILLTFGGLTSFNHISADRSGTELAGLTEHYQDFNTTLGYAQNGISLLTKLDFSKFFELADTVPNMIINSAELVIADIEEPGPNQDPPSNFILRVLDETNRFRIDTTDEDAANIAKYNFTVGSRFSDTGSYVILDDSRQTAFNLRYSSTDKKYSGLCTLFMQELFKNRKDNGPLFSTFAMFPTSPTIGKSMNRVAFQKENVKLRIYYTRPTVNTNP